MLSGLERHVAPRGDEGIQGLRILTISLPLGLVEEQEAQFLDSGERYGCRQFRDESCYLFDALRLQECRETERCLPN